MRGASLSVIDCNFNTFWIGVDLHINIETDFFAEFVAQNATVVAIPTCFDRLTVHCRAADNGMC